MYSKDEMENFQIILNRLSAGERNRRSSNANIMKKHWHKYFERYKNPRDGTFFCDEKNSEKVFVHASNGEEIEFPIQYVPQSVNAKLRLALDCMSESERLDPRSHLTRYPKVILSMQLGRDWKIFDLTREERYFPMESHVSGQDWKPRPFSPAFFSRTSFSPEISSRSLPSQDSILLARPSGRVQAAESMSRSQSHSTHQEYQRAASAYEEPPLSPLPFSPVLPLQLPSFPQQAAIPIAPLSEQREGPESHSRSLSFSASQRPFGIVRPHQRSRSDANPGEGCESIQAGNYPAPGSPPIPPDRESHRRALLRYPPEMDRPIVSQEPIEIVCSSVSSLASRLKPDSDASFPNDEISGNRRNNLPSQSPSRHRGSFSYQSWRLARRPIVQQSQDFLPTADSTLMSRSGSSSGRLENCPRSSEEQPSFPHRLMPKRSHEEPPLFYTIVEHSAASASAVSRRMSDSPNVQRYPRKRPYVNSQFSDLQNEEGKKRQGDGREDTHPVCSPSVSLPSALPQPRPGEQDRLLFFNPMTFNPKGDTANCVLTTRYGYNYMNRIDESPQAATSGWAPPEPMEAVRDDWRRAYNMSPAEIDRKMRSYPPGANGVLAHKDKNDGGHELWIQHVPMRSDLPYANGGVLVLDLQCGISFPVGMLNPSHAYAVSWNSVRNSVHPGRNECPARKVNEEEIFQPRMPHVSVNFPILQSRYHRMLSHVEKAQLPEDVRGWNAAWEHQMRVPAVQAPVNWNAVLAPQRGVRDGR